MSKVDDDLKSNQETILKYLKQKLSKKKKSKIEVNIALAKDGDK